MSNAGQAISSVVGATIGFFVGGPTGALYGFQVGLLGGSALFPTEAPGRQGPRLEDFETLQADPGAPVFQVFGTVAVPGFRMYLGPVTETSNTEEVGGKGPPTQEVTTFQYFQTLGLGLCEGEIAGVTRIWENGQLVYDLRGQQSGESDADFNARVQMSDEYAETFTLYVGDEAQEADPTLELEQGMGNVPGFRGLAYMVFPDRELKADQGNRHPSFKIEISRPVVATVEALTVTGAGTWDVPEGVTSISDVLIVAGGGGGGSARSTGGGGAGGYVYERNVAVTPEGAINYVVGAGGKTSGGAENGDDSTWDDESFVAVGGGRGGENTGATGADGGSGGGGLGEFPAEGGDGVEGQGSDGGAGENVSQFNGAGGGGGGAGATGQDGNGDLEVGGAGGIGIYFGDVFGEEYGEQGWFCGGGGGAGGGAAGVAGGDGGLGGGKGGDSPGTGDDVGDRFENAFNNSGGGGGGGSGGESSVGQGQHGVILLKYFQNPEVESLTIDSIVEHICLRAGLNQDQFDVTSLAEIPIAGYAITRESSARGAIEPLRMAGLFDIVESGETLRFPARGGASVATLTDDDLGVVEEGAELAPNVTTRKLQDFELPRQIRLQYPAFDRDYEIGEQLSPARVGTVGVNEVSIQIPVVLTDARAAEIAEITFREAWASRWSHEFSLDPSWHHLEPADVVLLPVDGRNYRVRIGSINDAALMVRRVSALRDDDGTYVSASLAASPTRPSQVVSLLGGTTVELLDLPPLRDEDDNAGIYVAPRRTGTGATWPGARLHRSVDAGATYSQLLAMTAQAVIGTVVSAPSAGDGNTWDDAAEYVIDIVSGTLQSRTDEAVLAGANAAAVGAHGRWHVFQFANAELVSTGRYELTRLLLGRRGTEHLIGEVEVGDTFVLVSGSGMYRAALQNSEIGVARTYRPVTVGAPFSAGTDVVFTGAGQSLETFSPVYVRGERDGSDNLTISWLRRDRLSQTLGDGIALPMSEATEAYEVDVLDEYEQVVRTLESTDNDVVYSAAQQTTDFGGPQADVTVRVYQLSATVGRGTPAEAIV